MSSNATAPSILCVDDEPRVLDGLKLTLRHGFKVATASSGAQGLAMLQEMDGAAVVISDMRMPVMDGATFLTRVRKCWPDATRLLLTGETGRDAAVAAVNEGQIFRFLTKPCAPEKLLAAVEAAVRQHQLVTAEKMLLQQTVLGSIRALVDVLGIVNPIAFGRGSRIKRLAMQLAEQAGLPSSWELEAAALLSQIGYVSLPVELVEKAVNGESLNSDEVLLLGETPKVTQGILARIPRLENVAAILAHASQPDGSKEPRDPGVAANATVLKIVLEFDALTSRGENADTAIATLRARSGPKNAAMLAHLAALQGAADSGPQLREIRLREVVPGMVLMDDLRTDLGTLLVSRGYEISQSFIDRMRNFGPGLLEERVRVQVNRTAVEKPPRASSG
jgi:response regulator RpfG family c-di-GMP phosphodiesterase